MGITLKKKIISALATVGLLSPLLATAQTQTLTNGITIYATLTNTTVTMSNTASCASRRR